MAKIVHYRKDCIGCNSCVENCPSMWKINEKDGKADLKDSEKKGDTYVTDLDLALLEENEKAAKDCPVKIIKIFK
ncbi:ferredoxin [Candidatus Woesearchaeota archaeon]|nr:ferredoxin [Candidatus Woesearchaeota archaeon]